MEFAFDLGDGYQRWVRGMPKPDHHFAAMKEDLYIYVIGSIMRYVHVNFASRSLGVLRSFKHGFDSVAILEAEPMKEIYAIAEKGMNPRVHICRIERSRKTESMWHHKVEAKLRGIRATEIRAIRFNHKDLVIILTGYPTFSLSIWRWTTEQEMMTSSLANEPSEFSDLLISPISDNHWIEYGRTHLIFYDLQSFIKNDVNKTQIYIPQRFINYERTDLKFGQPNAMFIISACFTCFGDFYVLDNQLGLHILNQTEKVLTWLCTIGYGFLGTSISKIVPLGDCVAEVHTDGWVLAYDIDDSLKLRVKRSFKLTSGVARYFQFSGKPDSFLAITERNGVIEGVDRGKMIAPLCIPDFLFSNVRMAVFLESLNSAFCAILTDRGKIVIVDSESGDAVEKWNLPFKVTCIQCHPFLTFLYCGTTYGCINVLEISNLKSPKLIAKKYLSKKDRESHFSTMAIAGEGRYLVTGDVNMDKVYLLYALPFEDFEYLDHITLPGEVRTINSNSFGERIQLLVYSKNKVEELCPTFVYHFSIHGGRFHMIAAHSIDNPVSALCFSPNPKWIFTFHPDKKMIGLTPFPEEHIGGHYLHKPEKYVGPIFPMDLAKMVLQGNKLYTFGGDGNICIFKCQDNDDNPFELETSVYTHSAYEGGTADGIISLDATQLIAIGWDGTFTRVRFHPAPWEGPDWNTLGIPNANKIRDCQMSSFKRDQEKLKEGKKPKKRIDMIRIKADVYTAAELQDYEVDDELVKALKSATEQAVKDTESIIGSVKSKKGKKSKDAGDQTEEGLLGVPGFQGTGKRGSKSRMRRSQIRLQLEEEAAKLRQQTGQEEDVKITEEDIKTVMHEKEKEREKERERKLREIEEREKARAEKDDKTEKPAGPSKSTKGRHRTGKTKSKTKGTKSQKHPHQHQHSPKHSHSKRNMNTHADKEGEKEPEKESQKKSVPGTGRLELRRAPQVHASDFFSESTSQVHLDPFRDLSKDKDDLVSSAASISTTTDKTESSKSTTSSDEVKGLGDTLDAKAKQDMSTLQSFFDVSESVDVIYKKEEAPGVFRMLAGIDPDGVYCVSYRVSDTEMTSPEYWAKYEYTLLSRQFSPKVRRLETVLHKLMELFHQLLEGNATREPMFQRPLQDFNMDDEFPKILERKRHEYTKYCDVQMTARNNLRINKFQAFKRLVWDQYLYKGRGFSGYSSQLIVANYPLMVHKDKQIVQCQEERKLELRLEVAEEEMLDQATAHIISIAKMDDERPEKTTSLSFIKHRALHMGDGDKTSGAMEDSGPKKRTSHPSLLAAENEEEAIKKVLEELGLQGTEAKGKQAKKKAVVKPPTPHHKEPKKSSKTRHPSEPDAAKPVGVRFPKRTVKLKPTQSQARLRMQARQRRNEVSSSSLDSKRQSRRKSKAPSDGSEYETDVGSLVDEIIAETVKPHHRRYLFYRGIFGPGRPNKRKSTKGRVESILGPSQRRLSESKRARKSMEKEEKEQEKEQTEQIPLKRRRSRRFKEKEEGFVILSDEDVSEGEGEGTTHHRVSKTGEHLLTISAEDEAIYHMKMHKFRGMYEDHVRQYLNVQRIFGANLHHELEEMYQYRESPYLYHQLEAKSRTQLIRQIYLVLDEIYRMKRFFDEMFQEAAEFKEQLLQRMKERNERIREIYKYLGLEFDILDEQNDPREDPSLIFVVEEDEIPFERFYTETQLEELRRLEEDRPLLEDEDGEEEEEEGEMDKLDGSQEKNDADTTSISDKEHHHHSHSNQSQHLSHNLTAFKDIESKFFKNKSVGHETHPMSQSRQAQAGSSGHDEEETEPDTTMAMIPTAECLGEQSEMGEDEEEITIICGGEMEEDEEEDESSFHADLQVLSYLLGETAKVEDLLLTQIPKPPFMEHKTMMEYTLDEFIAAREYRDECEILEKVKAKLNKKLQHELHQLYRANANDYNNIDLRLQELFHAKIHFHKNILLEECVIMRIIRLIRTADDCQREEDRVNLLLGKLQEEMKAIQLITSQLTIRRNELKEKETGIIDRQNEHERQFRKDLGDVGHHLAFFLKNYKRKPKIQLKGKDVDKAEVYDTGVEALKAANLRNYARDNGEVARAVVIAFLDMDDPVLMPPNCPRLYWDKFCKLRRKRLICDFELKSLQLQTENITKGLQECGEKEDTTAKAMAALLVVISHRIETKNFLLYNTEFQFVIGRGHVEINYWDLAEHENSIMTKAENIEKLNKAVDVATDRYLKDTKSCIFIHRDVRDIEWKFKAIRRTKMDLEQLLHEVHMMKPSKELLLALSANTDLEKVHQTRIQRLKKLIEASYKQQQDFVKTREKLKTLYNKQVRRYEKINAKLQAWLENENRETSILRHNVMSTIDPEERKEKFNERIQKFLAKGYMIRKIHDNFQIINFLEKELERYYKRSFPCM